LIKCRILIAGGFGCSFSEAVSIGFMGTIFHMIDCSHFFNAEALLCGAFGLRHSVAVEYMIE
jgi:hypothetical protein